MRDGYFHGADRTVCGFRFIYRGMQPVKVMETRRILAEFFTRGDIRCL